MEDTCKVVVDYSMNTGKNSFFKIILDCKKLNKKKIETGGFKLIYKGERKETTFSLLKEQNVIQWLFQFVPIFWIFIM